MFEVGSSKSPHYTDLRFMVVVIARVIFDEVFLLSELYHLRWMAMVWLPLDKERYFGCDKRQGCLKKVGKRCVIFRCKKAASMMRLLLYWLPLRDSTRPARAVRRFGWDIALAQSRSVRYEKASSCDEAFSKVAPPAGLEPATYGLTVRRSTNWTKGELFLKL